LNAGRDILLQGGDAMGSSAFVFSEGTANLTAVGDLTLQGGSAAGAIAGVYSDSLNTINVDAANVYLLSGGSQSLLNVLDGVAGSTVNITTPGDCVNCVQVAMADPAGVVADVLNIFGQPAPPPPPPPVTPPVEPPVTPPAPVATAPDPIDETPVMEPTQPTPEPQPEPEETESLAMLPDDVINDVVVISSSDDGAAEGGAEQGSVAGADDDEEQESEETPTQCEA
jgi:hypothetical protein